jgi:hypothetical protein
MKDQVAQNPVPVKTLQRSFCLSLFETVFALLVFQLKIDRFVVSNYKLFRSMGGMNEQS